ncbi:hypothetical protein DRW41_10180 [Neobacillus piezotolerans]|uniref:Uncharacterized protein n=1 Tax=Neobacillus piezotolerans TaxID=2259171 RepID=A0A3D8GSJ7_9BACI|nr:hypothetical protein DRW41_10180 [Neobacillus piezotolerans]
MTRSYAEADSIFDLKNLDDSERQTPGGRFPSLIQTPRKRHDRSFSILDGRAARWIHGVFYIFGEIVNDIVLARQNPRENVWGDCPEGLCGWVYQLLVSIPLLENNATNRGSLIGYLA